MYAFYVIKMRSVCISMDLTLHRGMYETGMFLRIMCLLFDVGRYFAEYHQVNKLKEKVLEKNS